VANVLGAPAGNNVDAVTFYWRPGCSFCTRLRHKLEAAAVPLREVNIWEDPQAAARVRSVAGGNETVPTVIVGSRALVNPSVGAVLAALNALAHNGTVCAVPEADIPSNSTPALGKIAAVMRDVREAWRSWRA
jgi:mycoredoxin